MKVIVPVVLCLVLILALFCGCGKPTETSNNPKQLVNAIALPSGAKKLSQSELRTFTARLQEESIKLQFLQSTYRKPEDVDLRMLFNLGNGKTEEISQEDVRAFLTQYGWWGDFEVNSISSDEMNAILMDNMKISLTETNRVHLDGLYYVEAQDRFYSLHGATDELSFEPFYGYHTNNTVCLYYPTLVPYAGSGRAYARVTLLEDDGAYLFSANEFCELDADGIRYTVDIYESKASEETTGYEETVSIQPLVADDVLSGTSSDDAIRKIREQPNFTEAVMGGQSWLDISEYGAVLGGTINDKTVLYFIASDGIVYPLPVPNESINAEQIMVHGGEIIFEYMMENSSEAISGSTGTSAVTNWNCTLLLTTNELFIRTMITNPED